MYCDTRMGGKPQWSFVLPKDIGMKVPAQILDSVVFIGLGSDGDGDFIPSATGFFVSMDFETINGSHHIYLVTAKHVAYKVQCNAWSVRLNLRAGGAQTISLDNTNWIYSEDETVDLAVLPVNRQNIAKFAFKVMPIEYMFATDEKIDEFKIGAGDELFVCGLFRLHSGYEQNAPIVRRASLAMMLAEPIRTEVTEGDWYESVTYLAEVRSIGGMSGSPVFVRPTCHLPEIQNVLCYRQEFFLLGVMHGHWELPPGKKNENPPSVKDFDSDNKINMGIAQIVPTKYLVELLKQPKLIKMRKQVEKDAKKIQTSSLDFYEPEKSTKNETEAFLTRDEFLKTLGKVSRADQPQSDQETSGT